MEPIIERCLCDIPGCPGYLVTNVETLNGRYTLTDAKLIANRHELKALIPKFRAMLRKHLLDGRERDTITYLSQLERELST